MRHYIKYGIGGLLLLVLAAPAWAQSDVALEVVGDPEDDEQEFTDEILLPADADDVARDNAAFGIGTANRAREDGREFGKGVSDRARQLGRDGANAAEAADGAAAGRVPVEVE